MRKLFIDDVEIEIGDAIIAITKQAYGFSNLSVRNISRSNQFSTPKAQATTDLLESPDRLDTDSNNYDKKYKALYIDDDILLNGSAILKNTIDKYTWQLIDKANLLFKGMSESIRRIGDVDQYDFVFEQASYTNLIIKNDNFWVWTINNQHVENDPNKTRLQAGNSGLEYSRPGFDMNFIIDQSLAELGWKMTDLTSEAEANLTFISNAKTFCITSYEKIYDNDTGIGDLTVFNFNEGNTFTGTDTIDIEDITSTFRLRGFITVTADTTILFNGVDQVGDIICDQFNLPIGRQFYDLTTKEFKTDSPRIEVTISATGTFVFEDVRLYTLIEEEFFTNLGSNPLLDYRVKTYDNLPDISQLELFRTFWTMLGVYFTPDSFTQTLNAFFIKDLNEFQSIDWSDKFIKNSETISNTIGSYSQINDLKYNNDEEVASDLGSDVFEINNENIKNRSDAITLPFGASFDTILDAFDMADLKIYNDANREVYDNDLSERILFYYEDTGVSYSKFIDLDWKNLRSKYYSGLFDSLNRTRVIQADFNLTKLDVISFDFTKLVYIEEFQSYFYVLPISQFRSNRKTKVTLLQKR